VLSKKREGHMNRKLFVALLLLACASITPAQPDTRSPTQAYQGDTMAGMKLCELKYQAAVLMRRAGKEVTAENDPHVCIATLQETGKKSYAQALRSVKKPSAQALLKNFHAMWVPAVRSIVAHDDERQVAYQRRRAETWDRLGEAWERFTLENE
jgi:hypothetical protein